MLFFFKIGCVILEVVLFEVESFIAL